MKVISKILAIAVLGGAMVLSGCGASNTVKGAELEREPELFRCRYRCNCRRRQRSCHRSRNWHSFGGTAGAIIGNKMDKQAAELEKIEGAQVEKVNDGQALSYFRIRNFVCNQFQYIEYCKS
jgi:predicted small secreted protein